MASLPLRLGERIVGTFNLYAGEPDFFDAVELRLLAELAADVSFGLELHRREEERRGHRVDGLRDLNGREAGLLLHPVIPTSGEQNGQQQRGTHFKALLGVPGDQRRHCIRARRGIGGEAR